MNLAEKVLERLPVKKYSKHLLLILPSCCDKFVTESEGETLVKVMYFETDYMRTQAN